MPRKRPKKNLLKKQLWFMEINMITPKLYM